MTVFEQNNAVENAFKMDVYAIYLRKSRADMEAEKLGEGETLARHKKILTELAARKGLYIGAIYQEIVSGAESIEDRPEIKRLIEDCYAGKYKGILIVEVTRLSRGSQKDAQTIMDCLKYANRNNGVLVITPTKVYDIAHNHDDEEYMEFELFMSRREYKMIQKRMDRGRKQAVVEGNYMGAHRPYGWEIVKTKAYRTLAPHPTEFEWGKKMYEWKVKEKLTPYKIAERLTALGVPTYKGEKEWSKESIKEILLNPVNTGKVRWNNRMQVKSMVDGELVTTRSRSNHSEHYMLYDGKQPKMVDEETFVEANKTFHTAKTKSNLKLRNPLAGLLVCQKCGKNIRFKDYPKRPTTQPRYMHKQSSCKVKSAYVSDVVNAVIQSLKLYIEEFEYKIDNLSDVNESSIQEQIDTLRKESKKIKNKLSKLFDAWEDGDITNNEFVQRKAIHNDKIEQIEKQIKEIESTIPEKEDYEEKLLKFSDALAALRDDRVEAEDKNAYLKEIIEKIEFSRENNNEFILDVFLR